MHSYDIIFVLNKDEKLVVDLEKPFEQLPCYCQTTISFYSGSREYLLNLNDDLESSMQRFSNSITKSLNNSLHLHESMTNDIGYLYNEYLKYELNNSDDERRLNSNLVYEDEFDSWVGIQYQIWSCGQWAAWMYNDENGKIIFEITLRYPGFFVEEDEFIVMPSYEDWIKNYQPTIIRVISKDIAQKWLEQANKILLYIKEQFDRNIDKGDDNQKMIYQECSRK